MSSIPYKHACVLILFIGQNVVDFVDDMFKLPAQQLVYSNIFRGIETHDMLKVDDDGVVRDVIGNVFFSLKSPRTKRLVGRLRKKCIESQFQDKRTLYCSRYHLAGHNRQTCKNPLA